MPENILKTGNEHFEIIEKTTVIESSWPTHDQAVEDLTQDHFIVRDGKEYAGTHLIIDLWGAKRLDELELMEDTLREAVTKAGATLLHIHLHHFTPNGGISGVAVLAESHISVHSWPERDFAAFDVFMCGDAQPEKAIAVLEAAFTPSHVVVDTLLRGDVNSAATEDAA
ncbi:adenosylmethionine decarboxylase [Thiomicrospira cyclica]|uniref:S-adenosylmethionine decarboxylase proenzyme n=1 Tax=Thiomicrospira cyclica (strain DSM 14477 / JCM 11371 / ALM1) TaxID=717773 RepID=F6D950_THICA|nr:adenosylmethionine decarboxylase [Thiomicrospira cyclica]AEG30881.1 S-adenosylmethionine decarboxylase proenzyme [Thiomicrospira cyclica ALM1]